MTWENTNISRTDSRPYGVVPMDDTIRPGSKVHTINQSNAYVEEADPIVVYNCFCRPEVKLPDEEEDYRMPMEFCMSRLHLFLPT